MNAWIKHPALWEAAMKKAARDLPKWTAAFWRKVKEIYEEIGGSYELEEISSSDME